MRAISPVISFTCWLSSSLRSYFVCNLFSSIYFSCSKSFYNYSFLLSRFSISWLSTSILSIYADNTSLWFSFNLKLSISVSQRSQTRWASLSVLDSWRLVVEHTLQMPEPHRLQCLIAFLPNVLVKAASHKAQFVWSFLRLTASKSNLIGKLL
jgi:hypothetical protein